MGKLLVAHGQEFIVKALIQAGIQHAIVLDVIAAWTVALADFTKYGAMPGSVLIGIFSFGGFYAAVFFAGAGSIHWLAGVVVFDLTR